METCPKCSETKYDKELGCTNCGYDWEDEMEQGREIEEGA